MEDQATKLNAYARARGMGDVATYLGASQMDTSVQSRAKAGEFAIVYATPEKLFLPGSTLLHDMKERLAIIAVDEAHCLSGGGLTSSLQSHQLTLLFPTTTHPPLIPATTITPLPHYCPCQYPPSSLSPPCSQFSSQILTSLLSSSNPFSASLLCHKPPSSLPSHSQPQVSHLFSQLALLSPFWVSQPVFLAPASSLLFPARIIGATPIGISSFTLL